MGWAASGRLAHDGAMSKLTVFVTGASVGFGEAITRRYVAEGARVFATARRIDRLNALADELGDQVVPIELDVTDRAAVDRVAAEVTADAAVDVLVNNAGLALGLEPAQAADVDEWERMIDTNCTGLVYCTRALLPGMVERGRGHVVNLGSVAGVYPYPGGNVYGATKAFVHQFSLNLRADLYGTGVRVTCLEPGMASGTEFSVVRFGGDAERAADVYAGTEPLQPEDVADAVVWVTSQPQRVNVNLVEMMATVQAFAPFRVYRAGAD